MSDEQEDKIEDVFINRLGAKYPMVKVKAAATKDYGIKFYPSVYTIAPDGRVHSVPEDRMPKEDAIVELLKSVSLVPELPEGAHYDPLRVMWDKKQYGKLSDMKSIRTAYPKIEGQLVKLEQQRRQLDAHFATTASSGAGAPARPDDPS